MLSTSQEAYKLTGRKTQQDQESTEAQHARYQDLETEAAKWYSAIISFIIYTCNMSKCIQWKRPMLANFKHV